MSALTEDEFLLTDSTSGEGTWRGKFLKYFELDQNHGEVRYNWMSISDILGLVYNFQEFQPWPWASQVLWIRRLMAEYELAPETRGEAPHLEEGWYGISRNATVPTPSGPSESGWVNANHYIRPRW